MHLIKMSPASLPKHTGGITYPICHCKTPYEVLKRVAGEKDMVHHLDKPLKWFVQYLLSGDIEIINVKCDHKISVSR